MSVLAPVPDLATRLPQLFGAVPGHLDAATSGVPPHRSVAATHAAVAMWAEGRIDGVRFDRDVERSRTAFAQILGVDAAEVTCGSQVSAFAGLVAASLPAGARVLCAEEDFTSVSWPMLAQQVRGVTVTLVPLERLTEAIDARTTLVAVSAVQSADGRVLDLDGLADAADHHGADVFLDVTQAAGWLDFDATRFSYVCAGAYKWLLSPRGTALMRVAPAAAERLIPHAAGWYAGADPWTCCYGGPLRLPDGARRFDVSPAWTCWAGTAPSLELIRELGVAAIGAYDLALATRLRAGLGLPAGASPIVSLAVGEATAARLGAAGVRGALRAGRLRLACHIPATSADVDRALEVLAA